MANRNIRPAQRGRGTSRKKRNPLPLVLLLALLGALAVVGIVLVISLLGSQDAPQNSPTPGVPAATAAPTPTLTPAPTADVTLGGRFTAGDAVQYADETGRYYKDYQTNLSITAREFQGQRILVAELYLRDGAQALRSVFALDTFAQGMVEDPAAMAARKEALFAFTGDYCLYRSGGLTVREGSVQRNNADRTALVLCNDGSYVLTDPDATAQQHPDAWLSLSYGPVLVRDGAVQSDLDAALCDLERADETCVRMALGVAEAGHYYIALVDAPARDSGLTLSAFADFMGTLGCQVAYNLPGGNCAALYYDGQIINQSHGDRGTTAPRPVSDLIYLLPAEAPGN